MTFAVVIASLKRPDAVAELLDALAGQSRRPNRVVLSLTEPADAPPNAASHGAFVLYGAKGLCAQRNRGLDAVRDSADIVAFLDDDYLPSRFMVERAEALMARHPDVAGATGHLLADGINGPGVAFEEAVSLLARHDEGPPPPIAPYRDLEGLYGCNMVYRGSAIRDLRFDERLPLYGWQEDIDFATQAARRGRTVKTFAFAGVHRGIKSGRCSGVRIGYSQVINPAYLVRKGTMPRAFARRIMVRNIAANHLRALRPEEWVDRAGRLRGNWLGLFDLLRGRIRPEQILEL